MKKLNSNLYTTEKIVYKDHALQIITDKDGYLYSKARYPTKIKAEDLPEWYVYGRYYKRFGYMSAKGVVDVKYIPNMDFNHFLKDDLLLVSYHQKMIPNKNAEHNWEKYDGYDERIYGNEILSFLKASRKFSSLDISAIVDQITKKAEWLKEKFPEEFGPWEFDVREYFERNEEK